MKVVSLSVGGPREVEWHGRTVLTSIFKTPVDRRLRVSSLNFEGDKQSDLSVHLAISSTMSQVRFSFNPRRYRSR
jgi:MOSC domain-containing protein YiiM